MFQTLCVFLLLCWQSVEVTSRLLASQVRRGKHLTGSGVPSRLPAGRTHPKPNLEDNQEFGSGKRGLIFSSGFSPSSQTNTAPPCLRVLLITPGKESWDEPQKEESPLISHRNQGKSFWLLAQICPGLQLDWTCSFAIPPLSSGD